MVSSEVNKKGKRKMGPVFVLSIGVAAVSLPLLAPAAPAAAAVIDPQLIFADGFEAPPPEQRLDYAGTVGPAGGEISAHQGRVVLNFPSGALTEDTDIRVSPLANVGVPGVITPSAFDFGPDGTVFTTPVTLTLRYDEADLPSSVDESTGLFIVGTSHSTGEIVPVPGSVVDPGANTVSAPISGFSLFEIAISCLPNSDLLPWCPPICTDPAPVFPDDSGGELDTTFGTDGIFTFELGLPGATGVDDLLIDDQGRLLLAVERARMGVARILPDGEGFDPGFGVDGFAQLSSSDPDNTPGSIALRTDGRVLLHGAQQPPGGGLYLQIARFLPDGAPDPSFAQNGVMLDLRQGITLSGELATLPDGRIFVIDAGARSLYQFLPDGAPDIGFDVDGLATNTTLFTASRVLRRATGDWLLARGKDILEVEAQGSPGRLFSILLQGSFISTGFHEIPGGGYVLGGSLFSGAGPSAIRTPFAVRFQPGDEPGSLEPDICFGTDELETGYGLRTYDFGGSKAVNSIAVQADGRIILAGATTDQGTDDDAFVIRIRPDGEIDAGFGANGIVYLDFGGDEQDGSVAIDSQGRIVIASSSRPSTGDRFAVVTRLLP
jgi:uncharacterized delta-60 repeat protein